MKFKADTQYHFGKLHDSANVKFVRTPKRAVYLGSDLHERQIYTFADFYAKNPCNYAVGDNISICTLDRDQQMKCLMTKTILEPVKVEGLADDVTPLYQQNVKHDNDDLVKSYQGSITYLQEQLKELSSHNAELSRKAIEQAQIIAEGDVEFERLEEKYQELKTEYEDYKKEFGQIIKEAREPQTATLGDRLGEMVSQPEVMGALSEFIGLGAGWLKNKMAGTQPGLQDAPPPHKEKVITEDENEAFQ